MVADVIKYSGIHAKTCALRNDLLKYEDYLKLASSEDVRSFADALGESGAYKEAMKEAIQYGANRVAIERSLRKALYSDYAALYSFITDGSDRKYLDVVFLKYSVEIIKRLIRRLFDHRDIHNVIPAYDNFVSRRMGLSVDKLEDSQNLDELLQNVKGTEIYDVLIKIDQARASLFDYETQLDFYIYMKTHDYQERFLDKNDREAARHLNGAEVDLLNIIWIYRAKTYYEISNDKIFTCLIPLHHMLSSDIVRELVQAEDRERFVEALGKTRYADVLKDLSVDGLERDFRNHMNRLYTMKRRKYPYSLASVISHLYFKGQEIKNLTTLIECVRYKLHPEAAIKKLSLGHLAGNQEASALN